MVSFTYRLTGVGWSEAVISDGVNEAIISNVSYFDDALGKLTAALVKLLEGGKRAEFSWWNDHAEYRWLLTQHKQTLSIRITWYRDDVEFRGPKDQGKPVLKARCALRDFALAVLDQLTALHATFGANDSIERWVEHDFPSDDYRRLTTLLDKETADDPPSA